MPRSTETLEHKYNIRCSKFHINDSGNGITIDVEYTNGITTIPDCRFASVASEEDLRTLHQDLMNYFQRKKEVCLLKNKIIQYDFSHSKK